MRFNENYEEGIIQLERYFEKGLWESLASKKAYKKYVKKEKKTFEGAKARSLLPYRQYSVTNNVIVPLLCAPLIRRFCSGFLFSCFIPTSVHEVGYNTDIVLFGCQDFSLFGWSLLWMPNWLLPAVFLLSLPVFAVPDTYLMYHTCASILILVSTWRALRIFVTSCKVGGRTYLCTYVYVTPAIFKFNRISQFVTFKLIYAK